MLQSKEHRKDYGAAWIIHGKGYELSEKEGIHGSQYSRRSGRRAGCTVRESRKKLEDKKEAPLNDYNRNLEPGFGQDPGAE